jgi:hypothetical protein
MYSRVWESNDSAVAADLTAKGAAFVFQALAAWLAVVRFGVGCDNELDDDDDGSDDKTPDFDASMGAIMTARVRRPRAAASVAIALSFNGV